MKNIKITTKVIRKIAYSFFVMREKEKSHPYLFKNIRASSFTTKSNGYYGRVKETITLSSEKIIYII